MAKLEIVEDVEDEEEGGVDDGDGIEEEVEEPEPEAEGKMTQSEFLNLLEWLIGLDHTWQLHHGENIKQVDYVKN